MSQKNYFSIAYATRILIVLLDLFFCTVAYFGATLLRFNFSLPQGFSFEENLGGFAILMVLKLIAFKYFKTYSGIIRFTGEQDVKRVFYALSASSGVALLLSLLTFFPENIFFSKSILIIDYVLSLFHLVAYRIIMRIVFGYRHRIYKNKSVNVAIFGAGYCGHITKRTIEAHKGSQQKIVAFFDDNAMVNRKSLDGVSVYNPKVYLSKAIKKYNIHKVIIAIEKLSLDRKNEFIDQCLEAGIEVMQVPPVEKWLDGELQVNQIRNVKIEDLLHRDPIQLNVDNISKELNNKVILVTGAAGSIGSEMCRQIIKYSPKELLALDQAESPLVDLHIELEEKNTGNKITPIVADIRDKERLEAMFHEYQPDVIFHAAAYKHVPMMERHPVESVKVNVLGVKNVADLAIKYQAQKFVMVSTDKAVNPTNVMGATKRIAEIYTQSLDKFFSESGHTRFVTTRFGNVLGSNGSVVPRFTKQIEAGGPITVTHPEITRFFMTIPEACQLVLEAGSMGKGGEIYLFDMGKPVKIVDLAKRLIKLSGLKLDKDIKIEYVGLREGEKLYEELLNNDENTIPTHHPKIMAGIVREYEFEEVKRKINQLIQSVNARDDFKVVRYMKEIVPEFISNQSKFEVLDKELKEVIQKGGYVENKAVLNSPK
ncbi:nucleoside-diphosphate sugar epimerase/dehydratase [Rapidithrix thailandica]|uniref:Nucleoside-diphosphate sugar epimerase/dehydratase n=1 Tax=Rapidithrix thailandica TaxID=413964 RepID=A0AAW9SCG8_9BACT